MESTNPGHTVYYSKTVASYSCHVNHTTRNTLDHVHSQQKPRQASNNRVQDLIASSFFSPASAKACSSERDCVACWSRSPFRTPVRRLA